METKSKREINFAWAAGKLYNYIIMKKKNILLVFLIVSLLVVFTGCDQQNTELPADHPSINDDVSISDNSEDEIIDLVDFEAPSETPDPLKGEMIYFDNCYLCHGDDGKAGTGQGGDLNQSFNFAPIIWFSTIFEGRGDDSEMPEFKEILDLQSMWDLMAFVYNNTVELPELKMGKAIFNDYCSDCHGDSGEGGDVNSSHSATNFSDLSIMSMISNEYIFGAITPGIGNEIHVIEGLDDFTRRSAASFVRTLSLPYFEEITISDFDEAGHGAEQEPEPAIEESTRIIVSVKGQVVNGISGDAVENANVVLVVVNDMSSNEGEEFEGVTGSDGKFVFDEISMSETAIYLAIADFDGIKYQSEYFSMGIDEEIQDLEIVVFETTTEITDLRLLMFEVFFVFDNEGTMIVQENWQLINEGDKTIIPPADGSGILEIVLPPGTVDTGFSEYSTIQDLAMSENGFLINQALLPSAESDYLLFAYEIPYTNKYEWSRSLPISVIDAQAYAPTDTVTLKGSGVDFVQERMFNNRSFDAYTFSQENGELSLTIKGRNPFLEPGLNLDQDLINIIIGVVVLAGVIIGYIIIMRRLKRVGSDNELLSSDEIMDLIIALDAEFEKGEVEESVYKEERDALKELLQVTIGND